ncbi:MAG: PKD domain-containing protein [Firmicutes bacterium]|nr:PKD domain-containing protein [Bacillota bacterium]
MRRFMLGVLLILILLSAVPATALPSPDQAVDYLWKERELNVTRYDERTVVVLPERPLAFQAEVSYQASLEDKWSTDNPAFLRLSVLGSSGGTWEEVFLRPGEKRRGTLILAPGERLRVELYAGQYSFLFVKSGAEVTCRLQWPELRFVTREKNRAYAFSFAVAGVDQVERWTWDFGDGVTAEGEEVEHPFRKSGSYRLNLLGYRGKEVVQRYQRTVLVPEPIELDPKVTPLEGPAELSVSCRSGLVTHYGEEAECIWDFGDGSPPVVGDQVEHVYPSAGRFLLTMRVYNPRHENITQRTWPITVRPIAIQNRGQVTPLEGPIPLKIECTAQPRVEGSPVDLACRWDFGDGNFAEAFKATHIFAEAGYYQVTLNLVDRRHPEIGVSPVVFRVRALPPILAVRPVAHPLQGKAPLTVLFAPNLTVKGYPVEIRYRWEFGDGTYSDEATPLHTYTRPGIFIARLTVKDLRHGTEVQGTVRVEVIG